MDLSLGSVLTCLRASSKVGSGGLSVRFFENGRAIDDIDIGGMDWICEGRYEAKCEDEELHEKVEGLEMCKHHCGLFGGCKVETW